MELSKNDMPYDTSILKDDLVSRSEPEIYAFELDGVPNALKIGSTYIGSRRRIDQWKVVYGDDNVNYSDSWKWSARLKNKDVFFKDHAVHKYLREHGATNLQRNQFSNEILMRHYSQEFYRLNNSNDELLALVDDAIEDINQSYGQNDKYDYYQTSDLPVYTTFERIGGTLTLRSNQEPVVDAFYDAVVNKGRTNLLMYAVMRFGKTFTALSCAQKIDANLVVIVSAKANVELGWRKMCEYYDNFKDYKYYNDVMLKDGHLEKEMSIRIANHDKTILFLSLETLNTPNNVIKNRHAYLFKNKIDLLIIDETHFGARGERLGQFVGTDDDSIQEDEALKILEENTIKKNVLPAKIKLHLSGTPYRVMLSSEFQDDDIICFCQYHDILSAKEKWIEENNNKSDDQKEEEWKNDYFGFPKMIRFAYNLSDNYLSTLHDEFGFDADSNINKLFSVNNNGQFVYEEAVLDLFKKIDGEDRTLGFLNYPEIKEVELCRHIVCVMPSCASCDALESLFNQHKNEFNNLKDYELLNISPSEGIHRDSDLEVMSKITGFANQGIKTITLTVERMLTGSTVPQWDTMLYFKPGDSPQEYDQATFRLQNPYTKKVSYGEDEIEVDLKPQTLLVDFIPNRMFVIEEQKCRILSSHGENNGGNRDLEKYMREKDLPGLPIYLISPEKLQKVTAHDIMNDIRKYDKNNGILDELKKIPVDVKVVNDETIKNALINVYSFAKKGHIVSPYTDDEPEEPGSDDATKYSPTNPKPEEPQVNPEGAPANQPNNQTIDWKTCIDTYNTMILLYAFLTDSDVLSLDDIVDSFSKGRNKEIFRHVGLDINVLNSMLNWYKANNTLVLTMLDYCIQDMNELSKTDSIDGREPEKKVRIAIQKFGKLGENVILTPDWVCKKIVDQIPETAYENLDNDHKMLDIASTSGEFAVELYHKMKSLCINDNVIRNSIYTIPKNKLCYELVRKIYELLDLDVDNISTFTANSILATFKDFKKTPINKNNIQVISRTLKQKNIQFSKISLKDSIKEETGMISFNAVVGNPPYQKDIKDTSAPPIYHIFMDLSFALSDVVVLITPARFLANAGKTPKPWNIERLNDPHFCIVQYESESSKIFPNIELKGGVVITYRNANQTLGPIINFASTPELNDIEKKVALNESFVPLTEIIYQQTKFNLDNLYNDYPEYKSLIGSQGKERRLTTNILETLPLFKDKKTTESQIEIEGRVSDERYTRYIERKYISDSKNLNKYKVLIPASNNSGKFGEILSNPFISNPGCGYTQTYIGIGAFENIEEADAALKYVKTRFARTLLDILKTTQHNHANCWRLIPVQNFKSDSDIDWSKSIDEIDKQLFKKYDFTQEEIDFIWDNVIAMN